MKDKQLLFLYFLLLAFVTFNCKCFSFSLKKTMMNKDTIHAHFKGGEKALFKHLNKKIIYPEICKEQCIQGIVMISFEVDTLGNVASVNIVNSVHEILDDIAVKAVQSTSGKWIPCTFKNQKETESMRIPISFIFQDYFCSQESIENFKKGAYYYQMDSLALAEKFYLKSFRSNPQNITAIYNCSIIRLRLNDINGACNYLNYIKILGRKEGDELSKQYCPVK
jgi:TonB family protein